MILPLTSLTPDILQRIRSMHFISAVMKRHRHRDRILERFIPEY